MPQQSLPLSSQLPFHAFCPDERKLTVTGRTSLPILVSKKNFRSTFFSPGAGNSVAAEHFAESSTNVYTII